MYCFKYPELYNPNIIHFIIIFQLVVSLTASSIAIGCLIYRFQEDQKNPRFKDKPFKRFYTVYRPDDPRIENLKARPDYYNPEGTIPDIQDTKPMYEGWKGPKGDPVMADGRYAGDISPRLSMPKTEYHPDHAPK